MIGEKAFKLNRFLKSTARSLSVFILLLGLSLGISTPAFAAIHLEASHTASKAVVVRGETFTYTTRIENVGDEDVDPVFIAETLSPYVSYLPGTTWAYKGSDSVNVTNAWLSDGLNLGRLEPGEVVRVEFQVKVKDSALSGGLIESVVQIKKTWLEDPNANEWVQCAAQSRVKGEVLGEELPETGPANVIAGAFYLGYLGFLFRRLKLTKYL